MTAKQFRNPKVELINNQISEYFDEYSPFCW